jgi:glutathione S-transferase
VSERLTLYGSLTSSSTYKPMLYLALARLPFSFRTVNLKTGKQREPEYLAVNRYGQVPALRHRGLTVVQSNVVLDYLARATGHFEPPAEQDRWTAREWLSWEADNITNVAKVRHYSRFRAVDPAVMAYFRPLAEAALGFIDKALEGRRWLVGDDCSIADIGCWGRMVFMAEGGLDITT